MPIYLSFLQWIYIYIYKHRTQQEMDTQQQGKAQNGRRSGFQTNGHHLKLLVD